MLEKMKAVSNPLTIIALFASLAEVAGTVAIKLVTPELQPIFIWFVMLFPTLIVVLFFITLNFNAKVLYAPGDFKNEENYLAVVNAKQGLAIEQFQTMLGEAIPEIVNGVAKTVSVSGADERHKIEQVVKDKLQPVQSFAGKWTSEKENAVRLHLALYPEPQSKEAMAIWRLLHSESKPIPLNEIASKLNIHPYSVSTLLYLLIRLGFVKDSPDEDKEKTYSIA